MSNTITYIFRLESGTEHRFDVDLNRPLASGAHGKFVLKESERRELSFLSFASSQRPDEC